MRSAEKYDCTAPCEIHQLLFRKKKKIKPEKQSRLSSRKSMIYQVRVQIISREKIIFHQGELLFLLSSEVCKSEG